jgi:hypothetical protein
MKSAPGPSELHRRFDLLRRDAAAQAVGDDLHLIRHAVNLRADLGSGKKRVSLFCFRKRGPGK